MSEGPEHRKLAPWLIIGSMVIGMTLTTSIVLVEHCKRDGPYMDSVKIKQKIRYRENEKSTSSPDIPKSGS